MAFINHLAGSQDLQRFRLHPKEGQGISPLLGSQGFGEYVGGLIVSSNIREGNVILVTAFFDRSQVDLVRPLNVPQLLRSTFVDNTNGSLIIFHDH